MGRHKREGLNPREIRFCHEYVIDKNGSQAAIRSGFSRSSSREIARRMIARDEVWNKIKELEDKALRRVQATADAIMAEWANLGFSDPGKLVWMPGDLDESGNPIPPSRHGTRKHLHEMPAEVRRTVKSIEFLPGGSVKLSLWDKNQPLTNLGKNKKLLSDVTNININLGFSERLREAREKRLKDGK